MDLFFMVLNLNHGSSPRQPMDCSVQQNSEISLCLGSNWHSEDNFENLLARLATIYPKMFDSTF